MYELYYYCPRLGQWLRIEGPDYGDFQAACMEAIQAAARSGRTVAVFDEQGQIVYQV